MVWRLYGDIQAIRTAGSITGLHGIARALNERAIATLRGVGAWTATAMRRTTGASGGRGVILYLIALLSSWRHDRAVGDLLTL
jgi:hypothetical protein